MLMAINVPPVSIPGPHRTLLYATMNSNGLSFVFYRNLPQSGGEGEVLVASIIP